MEHKLLPAFLAFCFFTTAASAQNSNDYLQWSADHKLSVEDFSIKTGQQESMHSFVQFSVDYQVSSMDFLTKNFNKKVRNTIIKSASWIDTTADVAQALRYQQALFDLCEIYTRQFRKALKDNRKKLIKGTDIARELNEQTMAAFAQRRLDYDKATRNSMDEAAQLEWEAQIQKELSDLQDYAYDK